MKIYMQNVKSSIIVGMHSNAFFGVCISLKGLLRMVQKIIFLGFVL